jgi:hypothetical protein
MGLLETTWKASYRGRELTVSRNEWTKGFQLSCDGEEVARRRWSWIGMGTLDGTIEIDGADVEVHVAIEWDGLGGHGTCTITLEGTSIAAERVR